MDFYLNLNLVRASQALLKAATPVPVGVSPLVGSFLFHLPPFKKCSDKCFSFAKIDSCTKSSQI